MRLTSELCIAEWLDTVIMLLNIKLFLIPMRQLVWFLPLTSISNQ